MQFSDQCCPYPSE